MRNAIIAQSGGPTTVINNSMRGAIDNLLNSKKVRKIYGARVGILGVLNEEFVDITAQSPSQIKLLEKTPSAGVFGSCRYKIKNREDFERIIEVFKKHDIGYFFYCGGGDSMDTANKIKALAQECSLDAICIGIPKTIDNDVGGELQSDGTFAICDHDPGYGSVARNTLINILEANEENKASYTSDPVLIIGVMGRKIGFIPASARIADPERKMPLLIILPEGMPKNEGNKNLEYITLKVNELLSLRGRCIVVIGEGVDLGNTGFTKDNFGHVQFSSSPNTIEQILANYLNGFDREDNKTRLTVRGNARSERPGTRQRREIAYVSDVDLEEAYEVGRFAAKLALSGQTGFMSTILRFPGNKYKVKYDKVALDVVANSERVFPQDWISKDRIDIQDAYINWVMPLVGRNLPEFVDFKRVFVKKLCPSYVPVSFRK